MTEKSNAALALVGHPPPAAGAQAEVAALRDALNGAFPQRSEVVEGAVCAVLAGEHVCLLGPAGTGKSALVRALSGALAPQVEQPAQVPGAGGAVQVAYYERLLTKFSTPEELFGALDLPALKEGKYQRVLAGKLPVSEFAFVDEVFKASSSILNSLLTIMNERLFHNDGQVVNCPLVSLFGASNEMPEGGSAGELGALWDRFLLRYEVAYLRRDADLRKVMLAQGSMKVAALPAGTLAAAQAEVAAVVVTSATLDALLAVRGELLTAGIVVSDRRWVKCLGLLRAKAWLEGAAETCSEDLSVLVNALWTEPKQRAQVASVLGQKADPVAAKLEEILAGARESAQAEALAASKLMPGDRAGMLGVYGKHMEDLKNQMRSCARLGTQSRRTEKALAEAKKDLREQHDALAGRVNELLGM